MSGFITIVWRRLVIGVMDCLAYRAEIMIWMLTSIWPLVMMFGWIAAAGTGTIQGYDANDFTRYFIAVFLVEQLTPIWVGQWLGRDIRLGGLSVRLIQPSDPYWHYAGYHWGAIIVRLPVLLPLMIGAYWLSDTPIPSDPLQILYFIVAAAAAWIILFNIAYSLGLVAFWVQNVTSLQPLYYTVAGLLGGSMVPLDVLPGWVGNILIYTPLPSMTFTPAKILADTGNGTGMGIDVVHSLLWVAVTTLVMRVLWHRGLRRYGAVGN